MQMLAETLNTLAYAIGFGIFESVWRRTFGGGTLKDWWDKHIKWLSCKFVCHAVNIPALFSMCFFVRHQTWQMSLITALTIDCLYWALAHGPWFDVGRGGYPDEKMMKRYNKGFYHYLLDWCFPEEHRYGHFYDFCGMWLRYSWMLIPICFFPTFNLGLLNLGAFVALTYGICHVAKDKSLLKKIGATELAEYVVGFVTGFVLVLI